MVYIRPHVTKWAELFSVDMIFFNNYFKLCSIQKQQEVGTEENKIKWLHYDITDHIL